MLKTYERLVHIVGIKESSKFLLKAVCKAQGITQVEWIDQHLYQDFEAIKASPEMNQEARS